MKTLWTILFVAVRLVIIVGLVGGGAYFAHRWYTNQAEPRQWDSEPSQLRVEGRRLAPQAYQVIVRTQGTVEPRTESTLLPQVSGRIEQISDKLLEGSFFEKGEVLLKIEEFDYQNELVVAQAALAQAKLRLEEEQARAEQARRDWENLRGEEEAPPLVLREPQLIEARAAVESAEARVEQARKNLERTTIRAPFVGVVRTKHVDVGQVVSPGTPLADVFAVDFAEVRMPLKDDQLGFLDIPEVYRGSEQQRLQEGPRVVLHGTYGGTEYTWEGRIVRTEEAYDTSSRMLSVVAQVENPYQYRGDGTPPLKVGQYVEAEIFGRTLEGVFVIPRTSVRQGDQVLVIDEDNRLVRRTIGKVWSNREEVVVREGLEAGDVLCTTTVVAGEGSQVIPEIEGEGIRLVEGQSLPGEGGPGDEWSGGGEGGGEDESEWSGRSAEGQDHGAPARASGGDAEPDRPSWRRGAGERAGQSGADAPVERRANGREAGAGVERESGQEGSS